MNLTPQGGFMKKLITVVSMLAMIAACEKAADTSVITTGNVKALIENQQFCTVSGFDKDVHSTFSSFNGDDGSFTLNIAGTDAGTLNGTLSGEIFTITSGTITFMGFTVPITGGSLDFSSNGQSAVGDMEIDIMGEAISMSLKLAHGPCNFETLPYASSLPSDVITTNYLNLANIESVSRFRSGAGHDFVDDFETCRSMKHYYNFDGSLSFAAKAAIPYYSPVDGEITALSVEGSGTTIHIQPTTAPYMYIEIFHVDLDPSLSVGSQVNAGDTIGSHFSYGADGGNSDIAVWVRRPNGYQLISQFEVMSNAVKNEFSLRGVADWSTDLYYADNAPHLSNLQCDGQDFSAGTDFNQDYFQLN